MRALAALIVVPLFTYYVQCKRFGERRPVGVAVVTEFYGVIQHDRVTAGILATTSYLSRNALAFQQTVPHQISWRDSQT